MRTMCAPLRHGVSAVKIASSAAFLLGLSGCHTVGSFEGWAKLGSESLVQYLSPCDVPPGIVKLCRDEENVLGLTISTVMVRGTLQSWTARQYQIQLRLQGPMAPAQNLRVLLPILHSNEFGPVEVIDDARNGQVILNLTASPIGLDLLGAALMSPSGLQGVLLGANREVFLLDARMGRRGEAIGRVWLSKYGEHLLLESRVEYATLWAVESAVSQPIVQTLLQPGEAKWVRICDAVCGDPRHLRYRVKSVPTVPQLSYWLR